MKPFILFLLLSRLAQAQIFPTDTFAHESNPWYWKNRKPHPEYWQQDVHYRIQAELTPETREIKGEMQLKYLNNSPDTLYEYLFHLYQNAFQPGSYLDQLKRIHKEKPRYGVLESEGKGTQIKSIRAKDHNFELFPDNTIFRVVSDHALAPGDSIVFDISFSSWFDTGEERRRMKMFPVNLEDGSKSWHFDGVHWYPRISVYDRRMTWDDQQHLSKEFYGDFGTWDVSLSLPTEYIIEASGTLLNEEEVLPISLKEKISLELFKDKVRGSPASVIHKPDGTHKTWHYQAVNVHDFAFTADPTYRIMEKKSGNVRCIAIAREENAAGWQDAAEINAKLIQLYSDFIGPYVYPKMVVADAMDGMEYPMLTLDGGHSPGYTALLAHEIAHNWFFGMIGSNETYRAFMDEGFTQFLTMWAMDSLQKSSRPGISNNRLNQGYLKYMMEANKDHDGFLNTHSDAYYAETGHGGQYSMVYHKTAVMLYNLQYILGDKSFAGAMQFYFQRWAMAHPYPEDFRQAIIDYTRRDLSTFFDQWMESEKKIDYGIKKVRRKNNNLLITFKRTGDLIMPLDFSVYDSQGNEHKYHIPVNRFAKQEAGRTVLSPWYQFGELGRRYTVSLSGVQYKYVEIDPGQRLGDIRMMDNKKGKLPLILQARISDPMNTRLLWTDYSLYGRPYIWWNGFSGLQAGFITRGHYLNIRHKIKAGAWVNTGVGQIPNPDSGIQFRQDKIPLMNYITEYKTPFSPLGRDGNIQLSSSFIDGAQRHSAGLEKWFIKGPSFNPRRQGLYLNWTYLMRSKTEYNNFLLYPDLWNTGFVNSYIRTGWKKQYPIPGGMGKWNLELRTSAPGSDSDYRNIRFESIYDLQIINKTFTLKYRLYAQIGEGNTPLESQTYLAGGNPEDMMESEFYRARGYFAEPWLENDRGRQTSQVHYGGGYNLRGYSGYRAEFTDGGAAWYGNNGCAVNIELEIDDRIPFRPNILKDHAKFDVYLFADAGILGRNISRKGFDKPEWDKLRADVGIGSALSLYRSRKLKTKPLTLRADFPLLLSATPYTQDNFQFRFLLAVGRAF